ncbi:hypothetical protein BKA65DRAFT_40792 [Rhexocercosporidium sp. MPI-PUGE-AT-0058]|nr:hypothetical protein BKA65DRAFT_40792 [Rhexocercosporidium sp. MPI-PUGE-AT-0058]
MPYLSVVVLPVPQADKDEFLAAWPTIAAKMSALPMVQGVTGGPIVGEDGAPTTEFKFLQTTVFKTLEDEKAFDESDFIKEGAKKLAEKGLAEPIHQTFEIPDFNEEKPKAFTQMSRITGADKSKGPEIKKAWEDLMKILGKESFGGLSVGDGPRAGLGLAGWDSLEEAKAAFQKPEAKAAFDHYHSFGECKDIIAQLA